MTTAQPAPAPSPAPVVVRPVKLTRVCRALAVLLVVVFTGVAVSLNSVGSTQVFATSDVVAMVVLGLLLATGVLAFTRARVEADLTGVRVRGAVGEKHVPWEVVRGVRLDDGSPWASLDLHDDDTIALFAVQANDGDRATAAVLALRRLLQQSRAPRTPAP